jgi:hypothetical protein
MQRPRIPSQLSKSAHHRLNMYALSACAAGVGILALAQPVKAEIIYTKAHVKLTPNHKFHLDLNHDGIKDFELDDIAKFFASHRRPPIYAHVLFTAASIDTCRDWTKLE